MAAREVVILSLLEIKRDAHVSPQLISAIPDLEMTDSSNAQVVATRAKAENV
jgi:hypothetical protein